nr:MAG TPA: upper collar protein [Caudoviricetes sp.]
MDQNFENYKLLSYKSVAELSNNITFSFYYYKLMLIVKSLFEWENLPNNIESRWIEDYLFSDGTCVFYKDKILGFIVAGVSKYGNINHYGEPVKITPISNNSIISSTELINNEDCYLIRNNDLSLPEFSVVRYYAYKLTNLERSIDVNIEAQKTPTIVSCTDKQRLSLKQAIIKRKDNEPVIFTDNTFDKDMISVLNLNTPMVFKDLQMQKHMILNEFFTDIGVNNANLDKKERMLSNEITANNEQVRVCQDVLLRSREEACKRINEMFNLNISVKRKELTNEHIKELVERKHDDL